MPLSMRDIWRERDRKPDAKTRTFDLRPHPVDDVGWFAIHGPLDGERGVCEVIRCPMGIKRGRVDNWPDAFALAEKLSFQDILDDIAAAEAKLAAAHRALAYLFTNGS